MSATERLGNITDFDSARPARDANVTKRYRLLDAARELLPKHRVGSCLHVPIPGKGIEIWKETVSGNAHLHGVGRCGNGWLCPVCAAKIGIGRAAEIEEAIGKAKKQGLSIVFVTLTARHERADHLVDNLAGMKEALRFMRKGRAWKRLKDTYGFEGDITGWEITWGFGAGWHAHSHSAYFLHAAPDVQAVEQEIGALWRQALGREGLDCNDHGVKVLAGDKYLAKYLAKWGLSNELTSPDKGGRKDNYTPFQLLALYEQGESWAGGLYQELAGATKGLSMLRWSRGLRAYFGMGDEVSDQDLAEAETTEGAVKVLAMCWQDYKKLLYTGRRGIIGEMLMVAERGRDALLLWLSLFDVAPP